MEEIQKEKELLITQLNKLDQEKVLNTSIEEHTVHWGRMIWPQDNITTIAELETHLHSKQYLMLLLQSRLMERYSHFKGEGYSEIARKVQEIANQKVDFIQKRQNDERTAATSIDLDPTLGDTHRAILNDVQRLLAQHQIPQSTNPSATSPLVSRKRQKNQRNGKGKGTRSNLDTSRTHRPKSPQGYKPKNGQPAAKASSTRRNGKSVQTHHKRKRV